MLKILIPTDFAQESDHAWIMANLLNKKIDLEVHFLHVLSLPDTITLNSNGDLVSDGDVDLKSYESMKMLALAKLQALKTLGPNIQVHLTSGLLTESIIRFAEEGFFDLILMGTKGYWGVRQKVSGSETQLIVRKSEIPVFSLMCDRSDLELKKILYVHDFAHTERQDLRVMRMIQKGFESELHFLHILKKEDNDKKDYFISRMLEFAALNGISNFIPHVISDRSVVDGVVHFNQAEEMDLICMGTHARTGLSRLFGTGTAEKLVNYLYKPMITYHI